MDCGHYSIPRPSMFVNFTIPRRKNLREKKKIPNNGGGDLWKGIGLEFKTFLDLAAVASLL